MHASSCRRSAGLLLLAALTVATPLQAKSLLSQIEICDNEKLPAAERLHACTAIIDDPAASADERSSALVNRGEAYDEDKQHDRAIADYTAAIAINPDDAAAYLLRGNAHDAKGDSAKALADYDKAISLDPNDASGYFNRATVYHARGEQERAVADYAKALEIDPGYDSAKEAMAELKTKQR